MLMNNEIKTNINFRVSYRSMCLKVALASYLKMITHLRQYPLARAPVVVEDYFVFQHHLLRRNPTLHTQRRTHLIQLAHIRFDIQVYIILFN